MSIEKQLMWIVAIIVVGVFLLGGQACRDIPATPGVSGRLDSEYTHKCDEKFFQRLHDIFLR
jgi:hypothetical protein